jgi:uncharacterized protein YjbI with pentapeptide repeats
VNRNELRRPVVLAAIGVSATLILALVVVVVLLRTGGAKAVSDNAALIGALVALGGVFTAQMVSIALDDRRTQESRELEAQSAHEAALQNYLEQVGTLLIEQPLRRARPGDNLSTVVRAQTLAVLEGLDPNRKRILLQFLYESGLIDSHKPVVSLAAANLSEAELSEANLSHADLSGAFLWKAILTKAKLGEANLGEANLSHADLSHADLSHADLGGAFLGKTILTKATLSVANLSYADLSEANLSEAILANANLSAAWLWKANLWKAYMPWANLVEAFLAETNLSEAILGEANLSGANLGGVTVGGEANLSGANLSGADLSGAATSLTNEELEQQALSLAGAIMPDGQKYEDWLKDKEARKEGGKDE